MQIQYLVWTWSWPTEASLSGCHTLTMANAFLFFITGRRINILAIVGAGAKLSE